MAMTVEQADRGHSLPDFLVIGGQRAGTTLLYQLFLAHPEIYVPMRRKELHFFDQYYGRGLGWYATHFPARNVPSATRQ